MTPTAIAFDQWTRSRFVELNTELEQLYFGQSDRANVAGIGESLKQTLVDEGHEHIVRLVAEGNTDEGFEAGFDLLGNVGLYMGACRRHEITEPGRESTSPLVEASGLAMQLGASLGVAPRFATSHLSTHNPCIDGNYKRFTSLDAECQFLEYNTRGIFAYKRAADALVRILPLGMSHPVARDLLQAARQALDDVYTFNAGLAKALDIDAFFYSVRPYYKPYRVGRTEYRGANAGDFAGINEIDLLLGLCRAENPSYAQLLVDKFLFMMPEDQARLRDCMRRRSLLDQLLELAETGPDKPGFAATARAFLEVCEAHGRAAAQHHDLLVEHFIRKPAEALESRHLGNVTASGPPLPVMLDALDKLKGLRCAAPRDDIPSRYRDIEQLRRAVGSPPE